MWRLILKISAACKLLIAEHALNSRLISLRKLFRNGLYCIFNFYFFIIFIHLFLYYYYCFFLALVGITAPSMQFLAIAW